MRHFNLTPRQFWAVAGLILALAAWMRFYTVANTFIDMPYRADSAQYVNYAYNLRHHGVYSRQQSSIGHQDVVPVPDAMRTPGYSLFLVPFMADPPNRANFHVIGWWQVWLGVLVVLFVLLLFRRILPPALTLLVAALVAISPQQVVIPTFNLSENLFTPLLVLVVLVLAWSLRGHRGFRWGLLATGVAIGLAALTRPVLEFFMPLLAVLVFLSFPRKQALQAIGMLVLGFALMWGPWVVRNYATLGRSGDNTLMIATVHQGMYPGLMYHDDPQSQGIPYRFDPDYKRTSASMGSALAEVARHWREQPWRELKWYLIGKPIMLWSWNMLAISPHADVFIYATRASPYYGNAFFIVTHALMRVLHWPLVILAYLGAIFALLPFARKIYSDKALFLLRAMAILLLYNTAVLMIGAPFARYSTPFLPIAFGMAAAFVLGCVRWRCKRPDMPGEDAAILTD